MVFIQGSLYVYSIMKIRNNWNFSVKILNFYIILLFTDLYHSYFQYLSITCNAFIACYIRRYKYLIGSHKK